jgi:hypothetical protein
MSLVVNGTNPLAGIKVNSGYAIATVSSPDGKAQEFELLHQSTPKPRNPLIQFGCTLGVPPGAEARADFAAPAARLKPCPDTRQACREDP